MSRTETTTRHNNSPTGKRRVHPLRALTLMGPAFIVGAWQFGPGNVVAAAQAGARFGYDLLWVIVVSTILMMVFTDMSVRIALSSEHSTVEIAKRVLGRPVGALAGVGVFVITLMFSVGNALGTGIALSMVFGGDPRIWAVLGCAAVGALIWLWRNSYKALERLLLTLVALMGIGFVTSAVLAGPDWGAAAAGLVPSLPEGAGVVLVALIGTNFSVNAAFYAGYTVRERGVRHDQYRDLTFSDTGPGIIAPGIMTMLIIVVGAAVLLPRGQTAESTEGLAALLEPAAGPVAATIFALGVFGAAFSSMTANATAGGSLLADGVGWGHRLSATRVKILITAVLTVGAVVAAVFGSSPVQMIIVAQALTVLIVPFLGVVLIMLANNPRVVGAMTNRWWQNALAGIGWLALLATVIKLVMSLAGS